MGRPDGGSEGIEGRLQQMEQQQQRMEKASAAQFSQLLSALLQKRIDTEGSCAASTAASTLSTVSEGTLDSMWMGDKDTDLTSTVDKTHTVPCIVPSTMASTVAPNWGPGWEVDSERAVFV